MKIFKKIAAGLLAALMIISAIPLAAIPTQAAAPEGNPLRLWYDEPVSQGTNILGAGANYNTDADNRWQQHTLPIGNGDMGANVYGEIVSEHLSFNEKTLWTGGPSSSRPDYMGGNLQNKGQDGAVMERVQELFLAGRTSEAVSLCNQLVGSSDGYGAYQPWGDIYFDYKNLSTSGVTNYQRDLDLTTAISTVSFTQGGTDYYREFFISHDDNVLVGRLTANGAAKLNLDVRFVSKVGGTTVVEGNNTLKLAGEVNDNQLKYSSYLTVVVDGGSVSGADGKLTITDADVVTVYVSAATDYKNTFWNEDKTDDYYYRTGESAQQLDTRVKADVDKAIASGYTAVKNSHLADYQEMFDRVELNLGQTVSQRTTDQLLAAYKNGSASAAEQRQLEVMLFQYGRYLTIASSREDSQLPSNLQGVWNTLNNPPWASDYHMNVNLQMNYWPTYSTNLAECALPLIDYIDSLREPGRVTAKIYNGADVGFSAHTQNTPFGWTCPGWSFSWGWSPAAVPWILQNCWEYYEYTGDVAFMRDYIYPMLKEEAQFYDEILIEDNNGELVSAPAYSPEHGPYTLGNTYEQSLVWQLYEDVVIAAETLNVDADLVAKWKANQANLKGPIEIGESGQLKEWYEETTFDSMNSQGADAYGHRHLSHMLGLFPGDLVQQNEEWIAAARYSMEQRTDNSTGWGMGQRINTWARLGDGNKAHELIQNLFKGGIYPNLWDSHAPFQIDGNFGMTSGVAEMLMQSNMGFINLLPALPDVWSNGSVDGLVARGNFEISMNWTKGGITNATILSRNGGEAVILADNITLAVVTDSKGNTVSTTKTEDGKISFNTTKGETYTLTIPERPEAPTNLAATRVDLNTASLTWTAVEGTGITYNVYRQSDTAEPVQIADGLTTTNYTDTALDTNANVVTYLVTAVAQGVESIYSNGAAVHAPAGRGMIDNLDSRIVYEGGWDNWPESVNYNGSIMYLQGDAYSEDATVTLQFIGTGIEIITCTNYDRNYFEVFIDGESYGEVDTYSASTVRQVKIFTEDELEYDLHTLVIKPLAKRNPAAGGTGKLELDALNVLAVDRVAVNIAVGETAEYTDDSGYYIDADTSAIDESVATVDVTGNITSTEKYLGEKVNGVNSGRTYVLYNKVAQKLMNNTWADASVGGNGTDGLALSSALASFKENDCWTITATNGGYYVQDLNGKYLTVARGKAGVSDNPVVISLAFDGTDWTIGENGEYLNDFGGKHTAVAGWSDINDTNSQWEIYEVITEVTGTTTVTFTGVGAGETRVMIGNVDYKITVTDGEHQHEYEQNVADAYLATPATCEKAATYYYSCECGAKDTTRTFESGEALGHAYGEPEFTWSDDNTATATFTCGNDASHVQTVDAVVTNEEVEGGIKYTATVTFDGKTYTDTKTVASGETPEYEEKSVLVGLGAQTVITDNTGDYTNDVDKTGLNESIATVVVRSVVNPGHRSLSEAVTSIADGKTYVFYNKVAGKLMNNTWADASVGGGGTDGLALSSSLENFQDADCWTVTVVDGGFYVQDANGKYLTVARGSAGLSDSPVVANLAYDGTDWTIGVNGEYLNDFGGAHSAVAGWEDINDVNSQWEIYEVTTTPDSTVTVIAITGVSEGTTSVRVGNTVYKITVQEGSDGHNYDNGFCVDAGCGAYQPATLKDGVYQISNGGQLYWFAALVNGDTDAVPGIEQNADADAVLTCDITVNQQVLNNGSLVNASGLRLWVPIGLYSDRNNFVRYTGTFDGQDYTISGLYLADANAERVALFGGIEGGAEIKNVVLSDSYFSGKQFVGGIVAEGYSTADQDPMLIENCSVENSSINAEVYYVGGIAGHIARFAQITGCSNGAVVNGGGMAGGIIGYCGDAVTITDCFNEGAVSGEAGVGGIAGSNVSGNFVKNLSRCGNTGAVSGASEVGGIVGQNSSTVEDCYNTGAVTATGSNAGGVVGYNLNDASVEDCYNIGAVNGNAQAGPIVGGVSNAADPENCYYLAASETDSLEGTTAKTAAQFASGEVAFLLNHGLSDEDVVWLQTLGTDEAPLFEGGVVCYDAAQNPPYFNGEAEPHEHTFDQKNTDEKYLASAADCEHAATYFFSCSCGEKGTEVFEDGEALGHDYVDGICTRCGEADPDYVAPKADEVIRLAGEHRWNTAIKVADEMKANLDIEKFDAIIIASGNDFADALAGSYLSTVKNAPILLAWGQGGAFEFLDDDNIEYIKANLAEDGIVYILGGEKAVPGLYEEALKDFTVKRLGGADRFETNLLILEEAGVKDGDEILVCTATNFADSLSASATGKPILLVFNNLTELIGKQPEFLAGLKDCTFTVIGGESAVSVKLAEAIGEYGKVERLAGTNRFETSVMVAEKYFENPETAVLAYAWNYPDGLCGGSLAYSLKAPLILTMTKYEDAAVEYAKTTGIKTGLVLGGDALISDASVRTIFAMDADAEIVVK